MIMTMAVLIIFPVILHTVINLIMLSIGGQDIIYIHILLPHLRQWISPRDRECCAVFGTEWLPYVVAALSLTIAMCECTGTGCWYGAKDDCRRVFTTSSGHVITAPTVPPTLQQKLVPLEGKSGFCHSAEHDQHNNKSNDYSSFT